VGFNRSEMARILFLYLDRPKEEIIKMFSEEIARHLPKYPAIQK